MCDHTIVTTIGRLDFFGFTAFTMEMGFWLELLLLAVL